MDFPLALGHRGPSGRYGWSAARRTAVSSAAAVGIEETYLPAAYK